MVVTVTAAALPESVTSASVTALDREEIEASGAPDVAELLRVHGFQVSRGSGVGSRALPSLRASEENSVLVLLDGIPLNDLTDPVGGSLDLSRLSLEQIHRVEIVRGPVSSLYGSEAMGGVINLITAPGVAAAGGTRISASGLGGSHGYRELGTGLDLSRGRLGLSLAASYREVGEQVEADSSDLTTAGLSAVLGLGGGAQLRMLARVADGTSSQFPGNGGGPEYSVLREPEVQSTTDLVLAAAVEGDTNGGFSYAVGIDRFDRDLSNRRPAILDGLPPGPNSQPSIRGSGDFGRTRIHASGQRIFGEHWTGTLLAELRQESGAADFVLAEFVPSTFAMDRNTAAAAAEVVYRSAVLTAAGGLRYDSPEGHRGEASPRLGVTLAMPGGRHRIKGNWGRGFRLPSFYALAEPNFGNPDLLPERVTAVDLGWEADACRGRCRVAAVWFRSRYRDLVDFDPGSFRLLNRDEVVAHGLELSAGIDPVDAVTVEFLGVLQEVDVVGSDAVLRDRPRVRGGGSIRWQARHDLALRLGWQGVGRRFDFQVPVPDRDQVGGYNTLDARAVWRVDPRWDFEVRVDNLLDRRYHEFVGFPDPGRIWLAGLRLRWER